MNKKRELLIIISAVFILIHPGYGQSVAGELKKVRMAYLTNKQLSFDVEVYSYATKNDQRPKLVSKGNMKKNDDKYYSSFKDHELMVNGDKALIVDNEKKKMNYYEYKLPKQRSKDGLQVNIDSVFSKKDSIVMQPAKDGMKHFTCYSRSGYVKQTEIVVDAQTYLIKQILYHYVDSNDDFKLEADRVEIFYKNIQTKPIDAAFFSFDKYFKNAKPKDIPVGKYLGYKMNCYNSKS